MINEQQYNKSFLVLKGILQDIYVVQFLINSWFILAIEVCRIWIQRGLHVQLG